MLAIFDLDETLIKGDCTTLWCQWLCEKGLIDDIEAFLAEEAQIMQAYKEKTLDQQDCMNLIFKPIAHLTITNIHSYINQFIQEKIKPIIYQAGFYLTQDHIANGDDVLIISASPHIFVEPIAQQFFNIKNAFGIQIEDENNHYTGKINGIAPYQAGKVNVLNHYIMNQNIEYHQTIKNCYFYSDSINDLPLLEIVGYPNVVNPDIALNKIATNYNWPVLQFTTLLK